MILQGFIDKIRVEVEGACNTPEPLTESTVEMSILAKESLPFSFPQKQTSTSSQ